MRIVIKVGTSTLTHPSGHLNIRRVAQLCQVISDIKNAGHEVILVSSGAIGMGVGKLGLRSRPKDIPGKQAAAAVGQCELMYIYDKLFGEYHHTVAQLLITGEDIAHEKRHRNFENTLQRLLEMGALPVINENDAVAVDEIVYGDNDSLSAVVATLIGADKLVILTETDGLYTADPSVDPEAYRIAEVEEITDEIVACASSHGTKLGTGGMMTKVHAAQIATEAGVDTYVICGRDAHDIYRLMDGARIGTHFCARRK